MSLIAWYPLTSDGVNQGLNNTDLSTMGSISYSAGKIGNAATFSGSAANCLHRPGFELTDNFTWTCWIKITASVSTYQFILSEGRDYEKYGMNLIAFTNGNIGILYGTNSSLVVLSSPTLNTWYHIAIVVSSTQNIKGYVNGTLTATGTYKVPDYTYNSDRFVIGKMSYSYTNTSNYFPFNGQINDVRIYDHCLSAKEVKEISKGLICHLPLNGGEGGVNLIKGVAERTATSAGIVASGDDLTYDSSLLPLNSLIGRTFTFTYDYSVEGAKKNVTGDYSKDRFGAHLILTYKDSTGTTNTIYPGASYLEVSGTGRAVQTYTCSSSWTEITSLTIALQGYNQPASGNNNTWYIKNFKIEVGNADTGYSINPNTLGTSIKLTDCSGYGYHGIPSVLPPSYRKDTTRHKASYDFVGGKKVLISNLPTSGLANSYTISWWAKAWTISGLMFWGFSNGNRLNYYGGLYCNTGDGSSNPYQNNGTTITTPTTDVWHHYVMVGNGSTSLLYLDGNLYGTALNYRSITGSSIYLNGWDSSSSYNFNGYMSDFRIYATALSASDIKELYQIPISIDKSGNAFAMEFIEDQKPEFHKSGIIENSYIHENEADDSDTLDTFHIGKTKTFANQILEV